MRSYASQEGLKERLEGVYASLTECMQTPAKRAIKNIVVDSVGTQPMWYHQTITSHKRPNIPVRLPICVIDLGSGRHLLR